MGRLDDSDSAWLAAQAPRALRRRDRAWFAAQRWRWLEWIATGALGLLGVLLLGWTPGTAAMLLLAGHWLGWLVDVVQWRLRGDAIGIALATEHDDARAWQLVEILRGRRTQPAAGGAHPAFGLSIAVDFLAGAVASVLALQGLQRDGIEVADSLAASGAPLALALLLAANLATLRMRLRRDVDGRVDLPMFRVGQRGIGLLVLVFGLMAAGGGTLVGLWLVGAVYGFFLAMGAIQLAIDLPHQRAQTEWLRQQLEQANATST